MESAITTISPTTCALLLIALFAAARSILSSNKGKPWIRVGRSPGFLGLNRKKAAAEFRANGRQIIRDGYRRHKGNNFVVQTANKEQLVIDPKYLPEIRMLPETKISHAKVIIDNLVGEHIGAEMAMEGAQHIDAVRGPVTKNLNKLVPMMAREYRRTSEFLFSQIGRDGNQVNVYQFCYATVSSITSAVLIGEDLTHIGGWNEIVMEYFPEAWRIRNALWHWPRLLRPLVKPFLVRTNQLDAIIAKAETFLKEPVRKRREPSNHDVDVLKFLAEYGESERKIAMQIVGIITGALNTSTHALTQALYDLAAHPQYIDDIRTEALNALSSEGGQWTFNVTKRLHLLDAFLKESLRLFAPEGLAVTRVATSPITLSDGTHIPRGTYLSVAGEAMALDNDFYPHASEFNPRRFLGDDGKPVTPESVFHGIEAGNGVWGAGRLTCPGRHFASAMAKIIVASLVIKFDIAFPGTQKEGPRGVEDDCNYVPDLGAMVVLKERG
ncbi:cytochrome P450 [Aspergillus mulundensis]|uniref:Cytochrome P450 n=1 Tax=Aspergillus mulundensis TaxID=1810919 RepID=A0A3D8SJY9_9EURO|nr:hypothetical protein DSM5745_03133 [Aspergillus mulundensis]RDW86491.1 hypothetical protein DSM5745_03133 [Aspergillus mulundensis]